MKKISIEIKWALVFVVMMLLWMLLEKAFGFHDKRIAQHPIVTNLVAIPAIAIYVLALLDKRRKVYQGKMTYMQGFITGLVITAIVTLFSPLTQYITSVWITPGYFSNVIEYSVDTGKMTLEEAESYFNLPNYIRQTIIFTPVMGIVTTAIVAIFTRKS